MAVATPQSVESLLDVPQIYIACPLTNLAQGTRRTVTAEVRVIKRAIEAVTLADRPSGADWPVAVYAPIDHSPPWRQGTAHQTDVYRLNLDAVHRSDAVIVLAENGGSVGVGQELEWAMRLGLPILYLTPDGPPSRQVSSAPAFIQCQNYSNDPATLETKVAFFLRQWRSMILDGPRRRRSRRLRYSAIASRLEEAWRRASDPTGVAAQCRLDPAYIGLVVSEPAYVAGLATDSLIALANELGVSLSPYVRSHGGILPVPAARALFAAAEVESWPDWFIERLTLYGVDLLVRQADADLTTVESWRALAEAKRTSL
jgi:hypothetical protein